jgi:hypothetical protein
MTRCGILGSATSVPARSTTTTRPMLARDLHVRDQHAAMRRSVLPRRRIVIQGGRIWDMPRNPRHSGPGFGMLVARASCVSSRKDIPSCLAAWLRLVCGGWSLRCHRRCSLRAQRRAAPKHRPQATHKTRAPHRRAPRRRPRRKRHRAVLETKHRAPSTKAPCVCVRPRWCLPVVLAAIRRCSITN